VQLEARLGVMFDQISPRRSGERSRRVSRTSSGETVVSRLTWMLSMPQPWLCKHAKPFAGGRLAGCVEKSPHMRSTRDGGG
jgi:hypothetical protein